MAYWRMQLHPAEPENAMWYAVQSIAAGFIGLDFAEDPGDLSHVDSESLPSGQKDFRDFAHRMKKRDRVLIIVHHFPFALVTVDGDYNYIKTPEPKLGVWFRHFRRIKDAEFYGDRIKTPHEWEKLVMTDTISILKDVNSKSYQLIQNW